MSLRVTSGHQAVAEEQGQPDQRYCISFSLTSIMTVFTLVSTHMGRDLGSSEIRTQ